MSTITEALTDRDHVIAAANAAVGGRAIAAADIYLEQPTTYRGSTEDYEQDAFTTGWTAAVNAVLADVRAMVGPNSLMQLSGLSMPFLGAVDDIADRFEVER